MSPMQQTLGTCDLCGWSDGSVSKRWAWFKEPQAAFGGKRVVAIERCDYNPDCRDRVEAAGKVWPLADVTPPKAVVLTGETARAHSERIRVAGGGDELLQDAAP